MTQSKAVVLREFGSSPSVETLTVDAPINGEVLVRTAACGVCHSDLNFKRGARRHTPLPSIMGHEASGIVESVGADVAELRPGDHVIACNAVGCGNCRTCLRGYRNLCRARRTWMRRTDPSRSRFSASGQEVFPHTDVGGFSEHLLLPQQALLKIAPDIPLAHAALLGCATITGMGAVLNTAKVAPGSTVAVFGCGGIGSSIIQGARIAGAEQIIAVDKAVPKLALAETFGATHTVDATSADAPEAIRDLTDGGVDYAFEAVGSVYLSGEAFASLAERGTAVLVGAPQNQPLEIMPADLMAERRIMGSLMGSSNFKVDAPFYLELYRQGRLDLARMVSSTFPLDEVNSAFTELTNGESLRSVIAFNDAVL